MNIFNKILKYNKEGKCVTSEYKEDIPLDIKSKKKGEGRITSLSSSSLTPEKIILFSVFFQTHNYQQLHRDVQ